MLASYFVLLQRVADALGVGEGCAVTASYPEVRSDHHHANSFRTAPSLCADMIFGKDRAYWLLHELRGAAPKRSIWRTATFETIRCTFLKIAVRIQELKTRIKMALPSSYPHVQALTALATSIAALAP